jgi:hypothetical protein
LDVKDPERFKPLANGKRLATLEEAGFTPTEDHDQRQAVNAGEIERMREVFDIAAHTRFHPILPACSDEEAAFEISASRSEIELLTGQPCLDFSYPNGDYGEREIELIKEAGFRSARTVDMGWNTATTDRFVLKALGTDDDSSINRLAGDLSGVSGWFARLKVGSFNGRHRQVVRPEGLPEAAPLRVSRTRKSAI